MHVFLIPIKEAILRVKWTNSNGTTAVIIFVYYEHALQIYGLISDVINYPSLTHGICIGGAIRKSKETES